MLLSDAIDPEYLPEPFRTRVRVWRSTEQICKQLAAPEPSIKYTYDPHFQIEKKFMHTAVSVIDADCLAAARSLVADGKIVGVLNMADDFSPLGFVNTGRYVWSSRRESLKS